MVKRSRPNSEDSEAASSSAAFPHKKKQKSTGAWPGWSRMFEWFGLKRPSTSTSTSTTMPAAEDDVVVVKVVEQVIIDDDDEEEEAPIVVESEDDDETEVDEPKPGDETEPFVPECDHATTPQSTRELTPPLSPEDMARWQRLKEDSTASIAGACTPPLLDENIYPTTGDELEIPNSPTMIYPSATDKLLETPTSDAASSRPPLADDDDAVVFSLSTEFEVLAASSPPLGAVDVTTELLPSPQSAPPSPAQNGSAMPATPPSRPGSQSLQPDSPPSPQIATPTSPSDEIVKFKSIYELHPSLRAPPKTATLRHTSVAPRVNKFRKSIIRPMSKQHAEQNFLKMMRDQMPETWADCARWPAPKSESARNPSFISARPATNGIKRREVMLRIQANIKKGKEVRDFLRPKIERYWRRQGKQLPQKPETPSYEKLLAKQQELDQELEALKQDIWSEEEQAGEFPELSDEQEDMIDDALHGPGNQTVVEAFNVEISKRDLATLREGSWLNDEVINFYGQLIMKRAKESKENYPKVHCFNTFFYPTLGKGYQGVRRWTKKIDIFALDQVIIPVHLGNHWTCAIINLKEKRFEYYDSLHGKNPTAFKRMREYLEKESQDKKKQPIDLSDWTDYAPRDCPAQLNGNDCGVFTCLFMEYASRQNRYDFHGEDMPYFRRRIIWEIIDQKLMAG